MIAFRIFYAICVAGQIAIPGTAFAANPPRVPVAALSGASLPAQFGALRAWSDNDGSGLYRLHVQDRFTGVELPVDIAPRRVAFDVSLGPDRSGRTVAVYSRCRKEPDPSSTLLGDLPTWSTGAGCRIFKYTPGLGEAGVRTRRRGSSFLPSLWRGRLAFGWRPPQGRSSRLEVIVQGGDGRERPVTHLPIATVRDKFYPDPGPTRIALRGRGVAVGWSYYRESGCPNGTGNSITDPVVSEVRFAGWLGRSRRLGFACLEGVPTAAQLAGFVGGQVLFTSYRFDESATTYLRCADPTGTRKTRTIGKIIEEGVYVEAASASDDELLTEEVTVDDGSRQLQATVLGAGCAAAYSLP